MKKKCVLLKIKVLIMIAFFVFISYKRSKSDNSLLKYVDMRIGTKPWSGKSTLSQAELPQGHVYPGVGMPFAMTQCTPQTTTKDIPYWWKDDKMQGFRCTYYPNGASMSEYAALTIMPLTDTLKIKPENRASTYSHASEIAKPHYYSVELDDYNIKAELTAVSKAKFLQFTFPESNHSYIVLDNPLSSGYYHVKPETNEIEGYTDHKGRAGNQGYVGREFACYFVAKFNKSFDSYSIVPKPNIAMTSQLFPDGFQGEFFNNMDLSGKTNFIRTDTNIDFKWLESPAEGIKPDQFSVRHIGKLKSKVSGIYILSNQ